MMTNLAHWQDDIDDALGGDFDGSLSGLCIMSLSFDFTRNGLGSGSHLSQSKENNASGSNICSNTNQTSAPASLVASSGNKLSLNTGGHNMNYEVQDENSLNAFKRFKSSIANHESDSNDDDGGDDDDGSRNQSKIVRQLQQIKNCLSSASLSATNTLTTHYSSIALGNHQSNHQAVNASCESDQNRLSPHSTSTEDSCDRASAISTPDDSSRHSTDDVRTPSPSSSISSHSHTQSQRSQSPSDMSMHGTNNHNNNNNNNNINTGNINQDIRVNNNIAHSNLNNGPKTNSNPTNEQKNNDNQQISLYSVKDGLLNGGTLKESSYTTSVITTTAPMHFKGLHHPFSLKQFPPSPYHQFSNSSFNHDFYDRYLSHDSHQPLQTPLIGIERTQDLLSLKLPPHGPDDTDSQRFPRDWLFEDKNNQTKVSDNDSANKNRNEHNNLVNDLSANQQASSKRKVYENDRDDDEVNGHKSFRFSYKSNSTGKNDDSNNNNRVNNQNEPIDLNMSYGQDECCSNNEKDNMFNQSMKHFNPERIQGACCETIQTKHEIGSPHLDDNPQRNDDGTNNESVTNVAHQYHAQESMFGLEHTSKQKFQYVLAAPISVATKLNEDTMTYLNQGQAYEIKLENITDVSEAKKGFMCSIINIGFHERHMQQAENELWQQWSQQHPNEKIFSVDMKLSYNVFGVESDGLNKYEFLWDSSKAAGVFIRINSISTEFTPKKHGGEKGVPFKLSIETFSYNSKTHDSYFISAACCQIKVFKPKGAERKIRSDRDKILKRPLSEQEKYHRSCDQTLFRECSLSSLHPMADDSLCYYRHSHGHFASKQVGTTSVSGTPAVHAHQNTAHQPGSDDMDPANNTPQNSQTSENNQTTESNRASQTQSNNDTDISNNGQGNSHHGDFRAHNSRGSNIPPNLAPSNRTQADYSTSRLIQTDPYSRGSLENGDQQNEHNNYGIASYSSSSYAQNSDLNLNHSSELIQPNALNQIYHNNQVRNGLTGSQHFNMAYYNHAIPPPPSHITTHIPPPSNYVIPNSGLTSNFPIHSQQHVGVLGGSSSIYRQLSHEKPMSSTQSSHGTPFRASNLAISSNNNFSSHFNMHLDQCPDANPQDVKDSPSTITNGNTYQHENSSFDSHLHHNVSPNSNVQQHSHQLCRQRSASASSANPSYAHCARYGNLPARHLDNYNPLVENHATSNPWTHGNQSSASSSCTSRGCANAMPQNHETGSYSNGSGNNHTNNLHNYDSDQNSPHKSQTTNDSPLSCYSRFKGNSTMNSYKAQHEPFDNRLNSSSYSQRINVNSSCAEVASWFIANRFDQFSKTFNNFSGSDLLRLSKTELIEICGLLDGIRLYNSLHNQPIKPRRILYICYEGSEIFYPIYLYDVTLKELLREVTSISISHSRNDHLNPHVDEKQKKSLAERPTLNSTSSTDSRSSMGTLSNQETSVEEVVYGGTGQTSDGDRHHFFSELELQRSQGNHRHTIRHKSPNESNNNITHHNQAIGRLLIDGLTSVKIVATEQVVQMLEDESVWTLSVTYGESGFAEACISAYLSNKRAAN